MTSTKPEASITKETTCPLDCPDACSLEVTVAGGRIERIAGTVRNPLTAGFICSKVRSFDQHVYHSSRIDTPLIRVAGGAKGEARFRPASWEEALERVATELTRIRDRFGGESILPFHYGGSNGLLTEDALDAQLFQRLGASRLLATVCAAPSGAAAMGLYGKMAGVAFEDYAEAKLIVVWGHNPHASGIHLVPILKRARASGSQLVVIDPQRIKLATLADQHLALRPGTDLALAMGVIRWLFENGHADRGFLAQHTLRADELERRASDWTLERTSAITGLSSAAIESFAASYAAAKPAVIRAGWGLERNRNGGSAYAAVLALPAVAGKFGVRGGGYTSSQKRTFSYRSTFEEEGPPRRAIDMIQLGRALAVEGPEALHGLFVYNCNPLMTMPAQNAVRRGLEREDLFTVVLDQVLTDTARYADVVLPATTFLEHHDLGNSYGALALQATEPVMDPVGEARPNYAVFADLLRRLELWRDEDSEDPRELRERLLERSDLEALDRDGIVFPAFGQRPIQMVDVLPGTSDQKIHLVSEALDAETPHGLYAYQEAASDPAFPLTLISPATARTVSSSLGELHTGRVPLSMHPDDARPRGLSEGDPVRIFNGLGEVRTQLALDTDLLPGVVLLPKGLWSHNTANANTANALCHDSAADLGGGACFNDARVEVEGSKPEP